MRNRLQANLLGALLVAGLVSGFAPHGGPDSPVIDAAKRGDATALRALIGQGADVNEVYGDGMTALHWAADQGNVEVAQILIQAGANVHAGTRIGNYTPLHLASRAGNAQVVEALLAVGSDPNAATTNSGATALHLAATTGSSEVIRALVKSGADVNAKENEGQTPLILAAGYNRIDAIKTLLDLGADVSATTRVVDVAERAKQTQAISRRFWELMVRFLDDRGGVRGQAWPPSPSQLQAAIEAARQAQTTNKPEDEKAAADMKKIVDDIMKDKGRQVSVDQAGIVGHMGGMTALLHAVRAGYTDAALELLNRGADINQVSAGDRTSPILIATLNGHFDLALLLLERGADPNLASEAGATPLYTVLNVQWSGKTRHTQPRVHEQQKATYLGVMETLLNAGADPNARLTKDLWYTFNVYVSTDLNGTTPFWRAALGLDVEAMRILVAHGADPNIPSIKPANDTLARGGGRPGNAGQEGKVDPSGLSAVPKGGPGVYPIHAATGLMYGETYAANEHRFVPGAWMDAVKYLVEVGADVNARDYKGSAPLHNAAARGDKDVILFLIAQGADVQAVNRKGQTIADMANGPHDRVQPFPEIIALLESLGSTNNHKCVGC